MKNKLLLCKQRDRAKREIQSLCDNAFQKRLFGHQGSRNLSHRRRKFHLNLTTKSVQENANLWRKISLCGYKNACMVLAILGIVGFYGLYQNVEAQSLGSETTTPKHVPAFSQGEAPQLLQEPEHLKDIGNPNTLLFVDPEVKNYQQLIYMIANGTKIVILEANIDGIQQITKVLTDYDNLKSIQILSHGSSGEILLGETRLNKNVIESYRSDLKLWGNALADEGDILLYGCNVAQGVKGQQFVEKLGAYTSRDVAASNNLTGSSDEGGDWLLEFQVGDVLATNVLTGLNTYKGVLAYQTIDFGGAVTSGSLASGNFVIGGIQFVVTSDSGFTVSQQSGALVITENSASGDFLVTMTEDSALPYFSARTMSINNQATGGDPGFGPQMGTAFSGNYDSSVSSSLLVGVNSPNYEAFGVKINNKVTIYDIEINGYAEKAKITIDNFVVDLAAAPPNKAPTNIILTNNSVSASAGANTVVGTLSTTDADTGDTHTYSLISGTGSTDNGSFNISGANLRANDPSSIGEGTYSIRVRTTDQDNATYEKVFSIVVYEYPPISVSSPNSNLYNYISNVTFGSINRTSDNAADGNQSGYSDYLSDSTDVSLSSTAQISVSIAGSDVSESTIAVFVDWNQDMDFGDTDEVFTVLSWASGGASAGTSAGPYTADIAVPANATLGQTRMRVTVDWQQDPLITGAIDYGEAEDYTINVISANAAPILGGTFTTAGTVNDEATTTPFSGVTVTDTDGDNVSIAITYTGANGTLSGTGVTGTAGNYSITSAAPSTAQANLRAAVFTPTNNQSTSTTVTTFTLTPNDGTTNGTANATTQVTTSPVVPTVASVTVPSSGTYSTGGNLDFTVNTSENVTVNTNMGTPRLSISVGAITRQAVYLSGSGTNTLLFRYTIQAGDLDTDGITVGTLSANGGTLRDSAGSDATLTLNSVGATSTVLVDAVAPTVTSVTVPANATYIAGQNLDFTVNTDDNVTVNTAGGTPQLSITVGATTRQATYVSGSGSSALLFRYTVQAGDLDTDGIAVGTLAANGGTLRDGAGNNAILTLNSVGATTAVLVDAVAPIVTSVTVPANATYIAGQNLDFTVNTSENVTVNTAGGTPQLSITVGATTRQAAYVSGTGSSALLFRYTIQAGDLDNDGIAVDILATNGGSLRDGASNNAILTLNSVGATTAVLVDTIAPTVTSVAVPANATYIAGQHLDFTVNTNENVTVNTAGGTPQLSITVGATTRQAAYVSGTGSSALLFRYTIQAGDLDADGVAVGTLSANGGTLQDSASNNATLTLNNVGATSAVLVDAVAPTVTDGNISISGANGTGGTFRLGDTVTAFWDNTAGGDNNADISSVTFNFSQFGGGSAVSASNSAGTWTASYTIASGIIDTTGRNVSGTVTDNAGNTTSTADTTNATVDNESPVLTDVNISTSGASGTGGAFKVSDTVTATWNNTAGGDNNADISSVTFDFSQFGGGSAISASNSAGTWTASYTVTEDGGGSIDATSRNVSVTATDDSGNTSTTADTTNVTVDNDSPVVSDGNISLSGASGTGGVFKVGDTVTATWNNTAGGDNNSDTISSVAVNFSQFGGGSAVSASNSGDTWTATYTVTEDGGGAIDATNRNVRVTVADNAGNTSTTTDTTNATVDNDSPVVTDSNISLSGATGNGGAFMTGDTIIAAWDNGTTGDNNADTLSEVTFDFSAFGGGSAVGATAIPGPSGNAWVATYTLASGSANGNNLNVSVTATDNAGNTTTTAGTSNATVDTTAPTANFASATDDVGSVTGPLSSGDTTDDTSLELAGTNESGSTVIVYNGDTLMGPATVNGTSWSYTAAIANGATYQFNVTETDSVGNTSSATSYFTVIGDTSAPIANFSSVTDNVGTITGLLSSGDITDDTSLELAGTNELGSTVTVYNGVVPLGAATVSGTNWSFTAAVADGMTYQFNVTEIDGAGNMSTPTSNVTVTGDTTPPAQPSVPDMTALTDNGVSTTDNKTSDTTPTFLGTAEAGATVTLTSSINGQLGSDTADGSGNWAITTSALPYGVHDITALASDIAGNVSLASGGLTVVINHDPTFTGTPTITGTIKVHETLGLTDIDTADLDPGDSVTLSYQWLSGGSDITDATSDTYVIEAKDRISNISCRLTARDLNGGETIFTTSGVRAKGSFPWSILIPTL